MGDVGTSISDPLEGDRTGPAVEDFQRDIDPGEGHEPESDDEFGSGGSLYGVEWGSLSATLSNTGTRPRRVPIRSTFARGWARHQPRPR